MGGATATIALEDAEVLEHEAWPEGQHRLVLRAPRCAARAVPGQFVHLRCDPMLPMRRPLSLMGADPAAGTVELLYKVVGLGTARLAARRPGERLSLLGPIGRPFAPVPERPRVLLLGGGVGIPPVLFLAERLAAQGPPWRPVALLGSEAPFPFALAEAREPLPGAPPAATATLARLERAGVPARLASLRGHPGCHRGYVTELAEAWLETLAPAERGRVLVCACGPHPMLAAVARLAARHGLPCQVALEEHMACGVGGCAGCTVPVRAGDGALAMRRVCVDGPVFDAAEVVWR